MKNPFNLKEDKPGWRKADKKLEAACQAAARQIADIRAQYEEYWTDHPIYSTDAHITANFGGIYEALVEDAKLEDAR